MYGRGAGRASASSLLQKVNSQLKGERASSRGPEDEEDDLANYLNSLGKKKAPSTAHPQWDKFGEVDDISISDDDKVHVPTPSVAPSGAGSKFLKKKAAPVSNDAGVRGQPQGRGRAQHSQKPGALDKAAFFSNKYSSGGGTGGGRGGGAAYGAGRGSGSAYMGGSGAAYGVGGGSAYVSGGGAAYGTGIGDSSDSSDMDMSPDEDVMADVRSWKKGAAATPASKKSTSVVPQKVAHQRVPSRTADSDDSSSMNIGRGGSKFLKKKPAAARAESEEEIEEETPRKVRRDTSGLRSSEKFSRPIALDSDDSMAEFIGGLSGSSSSRTPRTPRTPRGGDGPVRTPRGAAMDYITEEKDSDDGRGRVYMAVSDDDSLSEDDFKLNIMDLDELQPAITSKPSKSKPDRTKSDSKKSNNKSNSSSKDSKKKTSDNDLLHDFGLQTVDDLLGSVEDLSVASEVQTAGATSEIRTEGEDDSDNERAVTPLKSILATPRSPRTTPRSARGRVRYSLTEVTGARSRSPSPEVILTGRDSQTASQIYTEDFNDPTIGTEPSTARSIPEIDDRSGGEDTYSEDYTEDFSTASGQSSPDRGRSSPERSRSGYSSPDSASRGGRRRQDSDNYSDDFTNATDVSQSRAYSRSSSHESGSYSDSHTSVTSSTRSRTPSPDRRQRQTTKLKSREVQTGLDMGLLYHWNTQTAASAVMGPQYGMAFVDPTPIASHVVSAEALEAVTGYSPSVLALNDMLRQQLALTTNFMEMQKRLHMNYINMVRGNHQYTTLEDTKKYIKKHKKPTITFKEALKQVKAEMGLK